MALALAIEHVYDGEHVGGSGDDLVEVLALRDRLDARIVEATGVFEANGCWAGDGSVSFVAWLRAQAKMTRRSAQRLRTLAVRLRCLPMCAQAYAEGWLSGGQVEAIVARPDDDVVEIFAAQESDLVPYLIPMTVAGVSRAMGYWLARNRPEPFEPAEPERSLYFSRTLDDRWVLNGSLDAEGGSVVATALRLATPDKTDLVASPSTRRASSASSPDSSSTRPSAAWGSVEHCSRPAGALVNQAAIDPRCGDGTELQYYVYIAPAPI